MQKMCRFISDNTCDDTPNILTMVQRDDGDIEFCISVIHPQEQGISIRASGSRLRNYAKVISLFSQIIDAINENETLSEKKIKSCKLCGCENIGWCKDIETGKYIVVCSECNIKSKEYDTIDEAIKGWNSRIGEFPDSYYATFEFMSKQLETQVRNYYRELNRNAPKEMTNNIANKITYYKTVCELLKKLLN